MVERRPLETTDMVALSTHVSIITPNLQILLAKKYGDPFWRSFLSANSNEEKVAILNRYIELHRPNKKAISQ